MKNGSDLAFSLDYAVFVLQRGNEELFNTIS